MRGRSWPRPPAPSRSTESTPRTLTLNRGPWGRRPPRTRCPPSAAPVAALPDEKCPGCSTYASVPTQTHPLQRARPQVRPDTVAEPRGARAHAHESRGARPRQGHVRRTEPPWQLCAHAHQRHTHARTHANAGTLVRGSTLVRSFAPLVAVFRLESRAPIDFEDDDVQVGPPPVAAGACIHIETCRRC
jgi:hypothetical protein